MPTILGDKIKKLRKGKNLTLEGLAKKANISKSYLWELENNDAKKPSAEILAQIAEHLDVTTDFLLEKDDREPTEIDSDNSFFRNYKNLESSQKAQLRDIMNVLKQAGNKND
ncbi:helix-turn-helix domain-containing protein [Acinetobacter sp. GN11]